jgi:hypothetical protein
MDRETFPAAHRARRRLPTFALWAGVTVVVAATNAFGIALTHAEDSSGIAAGSSQRYEAAMQALAMQRYAAAFDRFAALADQGHTESARMALAMARYRPAAAGHWSATAAQLDRWTSLTDYDDEVRGRLVADVGVRE